MRTLNAILSFVVETEGSSFTFFIPGESSLRSISCSGSFPGFGG